MGIMEFVDRRKETTRQEFSNDIRHSVAIFAQASVVGKNKVSTTVHGKNLQKISTAQKPLTKNPGGKNPANFDFGAVQRCGAVVARDKMLLKGVFESQTIGFDTEESAREIDR